jgi:hypothetical protein
MVLYYCIKYYCEDCYYYYWATKPLSQQRKDSSKCFSKEDEKSIQLVVL